MPEIGGLYCFIHQVVNQKAITNQFLVCLSYDKKRALFYNSVSPQHPVFLPISQWFNYIQRIA